MLRFPRFISVLGRRVDVRTGGVDPEDVEGYGESDCYVGTAYVHLFDNALKSDLAALSTFIHESCHVALGVAGTDAGLTEIQEEAIVTTMENHIIQQLPLWAKLHAKMKGNKL